MASAARASAEARAKVSQGAGANRAMTLFTSLGSSADCRGLTQITKYQGRTNNARAATFSVSQRRFSLG